MSLPFKSDVPDMLNNEMIVLNHLRNVDLHNAHTELMIMTCKNEYAEEIPITAASAKHEWYIPNHAVYNINKSDTARVVFDCTSSYQYFCLNDVLLPGPDNLTSLVTVLCKFCEKEVFIFVIDLSPTCDTISHSILLHRLRNKYGITHNAPK